MASTASSLPVGVASSSWQRKATTSSRRRLSSSLPSSRSSFSSVVGVPTTTTTMARGKTLSLRIDDPSSDDWMTTTTTTTTREIHHSRPSHVSSPSIRGRHRATINKAHSAASFFSLSTRRCPRARACTQSFERALLRETERDRARAITMISMTI